MRPLVAPEPEGWGVAAAGVAALEERPDLAGRLLEGRGERLELADRDAPDREAAAVERDVPVERDAPADRDAPPEREAAAFRPVPDEPVLRAERAPPADRVLPDERLLPAEGLPDEALLLAGALLADERLLAAGLVALLLAALPSVDLLLAARRVEALADLLLGDPLFEREEVFSVLLLPVLLAVATDLILALFRFLLPAGLPQLTARSGWRGAGFRSVPVIGG
jgi:hypothetical protein